MPRLFIKDIPPQLRRKLKAEARRHRRSITRHALVLLEQALGQQNLRGVAEWPEPIKGRFPLTDRWLKGAIRASHP